MQKITNIEIKNFKSIRQAEIKDCRRINVFIGYPNVGKSNILEALSLFSINEYSSDFSNYVRMEAPTTLFFDGDVSKSSEVRINNKHRVIAKFENFQISFIKQFEKDGISFENYDNGHSLFDRSIEVTELNKFGVSNKNGKNNIVDYRIGFVPDEYKLEYIKKYSFIKNSFTDGIGYIELSAPFGENLFNVILANKELKEEIENLFESYNLKFSFDTTSQSFIILKFIGNNVFSIPYSLVADTLQRLIFYKATIASNKNSILLFEEPEAHMFPPYIAKFTSDIIFDDNKNQYFIATHSPFVLNDFMEELKDDELSIYTVGLEDGATVINRLTDEQITEIYQYGIDLFFNLENFLKNG